MAAKFSWSSLEKALGYVLTLAIGLLLGYQVSSSDFFSSSSPTNDKDLVYSGQPDNHAAVDFNIFWDTWDILEDKYLEPADLQTQEMVDGAVAGLVSALGDPYTAYLPATTKEISDADLSGSFGGIGIELGYKDDVLAVMAPISDTPADRAGIQGGDMILHVTDLAKDFDQDTYDWTLEDAQNALRGEVGSKVTLTLLREDYNDNLPFDIEITREEIVIKSVELEYLDRPDGSKIAHLTLSRFGELTYDEWNQAVADILSQGNAVTGIILDLRNNPGGYFNEAIHVASEFIPSGTVVKQQGRSQDFDYSVTGQGKLYDYPVVVLVNGGSASSSEIVAGALSDRLGAPLVGQTTFGKGLVQERVDLPNGAGLNITIAKWMTPGGHWIDENGLTPTIEISDDPETTADEMLQSAVQAFSQSQ